MGPSYTPRRMQGPRPGDQRSDVTEHPVANLPIIMQHGPASGWPSFAPFSTSETAEILQGALCGNDMHSRPDCFPGVVWHKIQHSTDDGTMTAVDLSLIHI